MMARRSAQRRQEFSFPLVSPARGEDEDVGRRTVLPPTPAAKNPMAPGVGKEDSRWLKASRVASPESGSSTPSPQLWAHSYQPHNRLYPASAGSSPSRAQAIVGYRREMLDLVSGLPEASYELSLRDIVDSRPFPLSPPPPPPPPPALQPPHTATEKGEDKPKKEVAVAVMDEETKKQSAKKQGKAAKAGKQRTMGRTRSWSMERSVSLDTGLLIKLFLPFSVGRKKVSPKPAGSATAKNGEKKKKKNQGKEEEDEEWWKKSEFSEAGSSSRTSSTNSTNSRNGNGSSGGSNPNPPATSRSRKRIGCYSFLRADKSKNGIIQEKDHAMGTHPSKGKLLL